MVYPNSRSYPQTAFSLKWEQENSIINCVEITITAAVVVAIINWLRESWS